MPAVSITVAQVRAIAAWTRSGGAGSRILIELESTGAVQVTRGSAEARIAADGTFERVDLTSEASLAVDRTRPTEDRFAFIRKGAEVRTRISARLAMELAAYGAGERAHQLGEELLNAMENQDEPLVYSARVQIEAPADRVSDPMAPVCLEIPDLDDSGDLIVVAQEDIERPDQGAGTDSSVSDE